MHWTSYTAKLPTTRQRCFTCFTLRIALNSFRTSTTRRRTTRTCTDWPSVSYHFLSLVLYCLIHTILVLHPLIRVHYLQAAKWEPDWIETAVTLAKDCWTKHYQPSNFKPGAAMSALLSAASLFALHLSTFTSACIENSLIYPHVVVHGPCIVDARQC